VSHRLPITISDEQYALLEAASAVTGVSMAEYVRQAIDIVYRPRKKPRLGGYELVISLRKGVDAALAGRLMRRGRPMQFGSRRSPVVDPD
jgi:hypothetical protein